MKFTIRNISIRNQALLPVLLTSIFLLVTLWVAKDRLNHEQEEIEFHTNSLIFYKDTLAKIDDRIYPLRIAGVYALYNDSLRADFVKTLEPLRESVKKDLDSIAAQESGLFTTELDDTYNAIEVYLSFSAKSIEMASQHDQGVISDEEYQEFIASYKGAGANMVESINDLSTLVNNFILRELEESKDINSNVQKMAGVAVGLVLVFSLIMCYFLSNIIVAPIQKLQAVMKELAAGNLSVRTEVEGDNEITLLSQYVNSTVEQFNKTVSELNSISELVAASSTELATVMSQAEQNAQQELSEIEQVASASNQLASTAENVSENASLADTTANEAKGFAKQGLEIFKKTNHANEQMSETLNHAAKVVLELQEKSERINNVIEVIGDVSERTNLLALNAAIEAARAGESGRGFAVVADEVRKLAARTQESTTEIQSIVEDLQKQSSLANESMKTSLTMLTDNNELTAQASNAVVGITESVKDINDVNAQVATAASEQFQVTQEINRNIVNISELVNQNVSGISQSATASGELSLLAEKQKRQLAFFKV